MNTHLKEANDILAYQYEVIKSSREAVFRFCEQFNPSDYIKEVEGFGQGSVSNTLAHIANTLCLLGCKLGYGKISSIP